MSLFRKFRAFASTFYMGRPQRLAAVLLVVFLGECLYVIGREPMGERDYRYARCGREMWERPSPLAGYFTSCGNLQGDGTLAYRVAGLPLTVQRWGLLASDWFRKPADKLYPGGLTGSTWESRHQLSAVKWLMRVPFALFAVWLGGGLWWVSRRLFGNEGGFLALGLYVFSPAVVRYAVTPNNEILAMWGLYGLVYTAMGVAHAMQGPRRKWKPRIVLLTVALGLTAAAHLLAAMFGFVIALAAMLYLAERRRSYVMQILIYAALGAMVMVLASFAFRVQAFTYVFTGGAGRFWWGLDGVRAYFGDWANAPTIAAMAAAVVMYFGVKRSGYFGNSAPFVVGILLLPLMTTQTITAPWLWALPFLFTFVGGVFADALETKWRKMFLGLTGAVLAAQAVFCVMAIR